MRFALLGSGSRGNATIVEAGRGSSATRLMLDCGFALREAELRLDRLGLAPSDLSGIVVTHEHGDHAAGAFRFARRHALPVWLTYGTCLGCDVAADDALDLRIIDSHQAFSVGAIQVQPFPVPHDAREPTQFVFADGASRLGILTDIGESTRHVEAMLYGVDALVIECNHDRELLEASRYPASLKRRIGGRLGHLANDVAAAIVAAIDASRLQHLVAAHLSAENNRPELAIAALAAVVGCREDWIAVADQEAGLSWRELAA
jgi:phosphoribosyl 1,2-cyclic phosphodiesterase